MSFVKDNLEELAKMEKREYFRKWRAANKNRIKQYNADYWQKRALQKKAEGKENEQK